MAARARAGGPTPSRRAVLTGTLAVASTALLGGCRLRLEDDAPSLPFLRRRSIPDERLLVEQYRQARSLADLATSVQGAPPTESVAAALERHAAVLRTVLTDGDVPMSAIERQGVAPTAPGSSGAGSTGSPGDASPSALASALAEAVNAPALRPLGDAGPHRLLLAAVATLRASAATVLGSAVTWPAGPPLAPVVARAGLEPARQAVYATEVAAARLPSAERGPLLELVAVLQRRVAAFAAAAESSDAAAAAVGYRLPFPITTASDGQRLVRTVLDGLVDHGLHGVADLPVGSDLAEVIRWHTEASVLRHQWGGPLPPFPGLAG